MSAEYQIHEDTNHAIRRTNRESFLRTMHAGSPKKHSISVLVLCYNNTQQFFRLLDRLNAEPLRERFAITIVQNSDDEKAIVTFDEQIKRYEDVTVLYPIENLGSAGGYAFGQEYLLDAGYDHIIMLEDDVELLERDTISAMIEGISHTKNNKDVIFIEHPVNAGGEHSRYVQIACYPASLLQTAGILDPRYYFRAEDLERAQRLEQTMKEGRYTTQIAPRRYYHPYLKGVNNSGSRIYFSIRNQLRSYLKHRNNIISLSISLAQYLSFGLFVRRRTGTIGVLKCVLAGMSDGLGGYKSLATNRALIKKLASYKKFDITDLGFTVREGGMSELKQGVNRTHFLATKTISTEDRMRLVKYTGPLLICGGFQPVLGGLIACMKKLFIIESLRLDQEMASGKLLSQSSASSIRNLLLFLPASLLGYIRIFLYSIVLLGRSYLKK